MEAHLNVAGSHGFQGFRDSSRLFADLGEVPGLSPIGCAFEKIAPHDHRSPDFGLTIAEAADGIFLMRISQVLLDDIPLPPPCRLQFFITDQLEYAVRAFTPPRFRDQRIAAGADQLFDAL